MVLNASFNELVFENRHKAYGAYQIRKRYSRNVLLAGFLAVSLFSAAIGAYFINMPESQAAGVPPMIIIKDSLMTIGGPKPPDKPIVKPAVPPAPKGSSNTITTNIVIVKDSATALNPNDTAGSEKGVVKGIGQLKDTGTVAVNRCTNCDDSVITVKEPRTWLPFPPKDPGLDVFFQKNIKYPAIAREQGIEGVVYLSFIVDTKGDLRDIKIAKGAHPLLDREVLRVAKFMPKWEPIIYEGDPVEYLYSKPVRFTLSK